MTAWGEKQIVRLDQDDGLVIRLLLVGLIAFSGCSRPESDSAIAVREPVRLTRPASEPLSEVASIGKLVFFDSTLSASGRMSCASCHRPEDAYASDRLTAPLGRTVPSLQYTHRTPNFSIGPAVGDADEEVPASLPLPPRPERRVKIAEAPVDPATVVVRGGLFWDGRANTLQTQALGPLLNPEEMGNRDMASAAARIARAPYVSRLVAVFGPKLLEMPERLVDEAMFAVARFQIEDSSFHPYSSRYDDYLEGRERLTAAEWRGLQAFEDPKRGNCAACHVDRPSRDGVPPAFTDYEYEALGVPHRLGTNQSGTDLGLCGPVRTDLRTDAKYCGLFRTPSLRNAAARSRFFHDGVYDSLDQVLAFYNFRDVAPDRIYPVEQGTARKFDDLPRQYHANVDATDPPLDRRLGQPPAMTGRDMQDIIAFLTTLTDRDVATRASASARARVATPPRDSQPARPRGGSTPRR